MSLRIWGAFAIASGGAAFDVNDGSAVATAAAGTGDYDFELRADAPPPDGSIWTVNVGAPTTDAHKYTLTHTSDVLKSILLDDELDAPGDARVDVTIYELASTVEVPEPGISILGGAAFDASVPGTPFFTTGLLDLGNVVVNGTGDWTIPLNEAVDPDAVLFTADPIVGPGVAAVEILTATSIRVRATTFAAAGGVAADLDLWILAKTYPVV